MYLETILMITSREHMQEYILSDILGTGQNMKESDTISN